MKKVMFLMFALATLSFGAEDGALGSYTTIASYSLLAAAIVLGIAAFGGAVGMGNAASATITGIARNPSVASKLSTTMYISLAMIEAQVIYALVIAFIMLFANPLITDAISAAAN
ncbi:F0F1 ATP synthase subunit C [Campylobacter corcagiensis]|uniref:ATP synthase subunit c n=1 Tax=Campylobacter corcagiensis TaxID=1448857 RepID=A0A7M1LHT8_9BACT|nr:F0F1 ATP synthase subunit C [Campylobacter corcagiensis]QKF64378.1 ATP synthase, F0 complex, c subunit [Campylobacter corcagiensis]QOQ87436.1 F0F1 ATP synthase subunit C [Campylobacter corcagiensis]